MVTANDDSEDWDRWMALRRMAVANCLTVRRTLAMMDLPVFRAYRKTGIYPGGDQ